jgi:hypothetical protein
MSKAPYLSPYVKLLAHFLPLDDGRLDVRCPKTMEHIGRDGAHVAELEPLTHPEMDRAVLLHRESCTR